MALVAAAVEELLNALVSWAASQPDVLALVLVGSQASGRARPDSDVDVVMIVADEARYLHDSSWLARFGGTDVSVEPYGRVTSLRSTVRNGLEIEISVAPFNWAMTPLDEGTRRVIDDGFRVLFDRDAHTAGIADRRGPIVLG